MNILPLTQYTSDVSTTGLQNNLIYDVPQFSISGDVFLPARQFWVQCYTIPDAAQVGDVNATDGTFTIHIDDALEDVKIYPSKVSSLASAL